MSGAHSRWQDRHCAWWTSSSITSPQDLAHGTYAKHENAIRVGAWSPSPRELMILTRQPGQNIPPAGRGPNLAASGLCGWFFSRESEPRGFGPTGLGTRHTAKCPGRSSGIQNTTGRRPRGTHTPSVRVGAQHAAPARTAGAHKQFFREMRTRVALANVRGTQSLVG